MKAPEQEEHRPVGCFWHASLAELVRMMNCYYSNGFLAGCQRMS